MSTLLSRPARELGAHLGLVCPLYAAVYAQAFERLFMRRGTR